MKTEGLEVVHDIRLVQVFGDHARSWRQGSLDPGLDLETKCNRLFRDQARSDHDRWIGGIRAGGDGRNHDGAIIERNLFAINFCLHGMALQAAFLFQAG